MPKPIFSHYEFVGPSDGKSSFDVAKERLAAIREEHPEHEKKHHRLKIRMYATGNTLIEYDVYEKRPTQWDDVAETLTTQHNVGFIFLILCFILMLIAPYYFS